MDFVNATPHPARILTGSTGAREMIGIVVCKRTFRIADGALVPVPADQGAWPVFEQPFAFRGCSLAPDLDFRQTGTDVLVFGRAVAPRGAPVESLRVGIACGDLNYATAVFGDRVWDRGLTGLRPTPPQPFTEMPLTNDRAYGGKAQRDGNAVPHPINPDGRGYYLSRDDADGKPLPNLERPEALIDSWNDQPRPACWRKPAGPLALHGRTIDDPVALMPDILAATFNQAVPELNVDPAQLGPRLRLTGFAASGELDLPVPPARGPVAHVAIGGRRSRFPSSLATLVALVDECILVATYRAAFRYLFKAMESRRAELRDDAPATAARAASPGGRHA